MRLFSTEPPRPAAGAAAVGALALGCAGLLPAVGGAPDPHALLAWLALLAPAAGVLCGARGLRLWPFGLAVPGGWMIALAAADVGSERDLAGAPWAALAWTGLFVLGLALGRLVAGADGRGAGWGGAGLAFLLAALLAGLPGRGGLSETTWAQRSPALGAVLFDLSPVTVVMESAGVDWPRKPAAYDPAGTDWFTGPGRRGPYRGELAGPVVLLLGWLAHLTVVAVRRGGRPHEAPLEG